MQNDYLILLSEIQKKAKELFWQINNGEEQQKTNAVLAIQRYLLENDSTVPGLSSEELIGKLYNDIFAYSVLSDPLDDIWITKISVTAWNDVRVQFRNGKTRKLEGFANQQQEEEAISRLVADSGLKTNCPYLSGKLKQANAKITVFRPPATTGDVRCIIEKNAKRVFSAKDYLTDGFAVKAELEFLQIALLHGTSILLMGQTGCGKTSFMDYLVNSFSEETNAFMLEVGEREIVSGKELLLSQKDQEDFICHANGSGCDVLAFNSQSWLALKAAELLPAVIAQSTGNDMVCGIQNMSNDISGRFHCSYSQATQRVCAAFPIIVYLGQLPDRKHRIMAISEVTCDNGRIVLIPIWQFQIDSSNGVVSGHHEQTWEISASLLDRMKLHGITPEEIQKIKRSEKPCLKEEQSDVL